MITATVRYLADVNALHLDPAAVGGVHQVRRETGEDSASSGQQGRVELVPDRGRAAAPSAEHPKAGGQDAKTHHRVARTNAQQSHH